MIGGGSWATRIAQPLVMNGIRRTLFCRWRIVAKDGGAELGTSLILGEGQARKYFSKGDSYYDASDATKSLSAGGRGGESFSQLVK